MTIKNTIYLVNKNRGSKCKRRKSIPHLLKLINVLSVLHDLFHYKKGHFNLVIFKHLNFPRKMGAFYLSYRFIYQSYNYTISINKCYVRFITLSVYSLKREVVNNQ